MLSRKIGSTPTSQNGPVGYQLPPTNYNGYPQPQINYDGYQQRPINYGELVPSGYGSQYYYDGPRAGRSSFAGQRSLDIEPMNQIIERTNEPVNQVIED
jgi:hypothetical protein